MKQFLRIFLSYLSKFFTLTACLLIPFLSKSQDETLNSIHNSLHTYLSNTLCEKIYLQTDKSFYLAGEILWFKAYNVDAAWHTPSLLSKVAYIELISQESKAVLQGKISLLNGTGSGSFFIPLSLPSGVYKLRAYSNWMKNVGPDYFFEKNITLVNGVKKAWDSIPSKPSVYDIQFFPEGGNLVDGISSVIGFKVVDEKGKGVQAEGDIVDQDKKTVAHFQSLVYGMGRFTLTPSATSQYKAYVRIGTSQLSLVDLPGVLRKGYVLKIESDTGNQINFNVETNYESENQPVYLLIHTRGIVKYEQSLILLNGKSSLNIKKNSLGEGINTFTLFNGSKKPLCERLYFRIPANLDITALTEMDEYTTRKKVTVNIHLNDNLTDTNLTNLGISVFRVDSLQSPGETDIRSYLYLNSDIKGYIESPKFYFSQKGDRVETAMDNLMLTQGWRRFLWDDVIQNKVPDFEYIPEYAGHIFQGRITNQISGVPADNVSTYLAGPGIRSQLANSISNKKGLLIFDLPRLHGSNVLVMQMEEKSDSIYRMDISNPFSEKFSTHPYPPLKLSPVLKKEIQYYSVGAQVQNAYLLENLIKFNIPLFKDSTSFYGEPDKKFYLDDYTRFNSMEEVIREYITGLAVRKRQGKFYFRVLNDPLRLYFDQDPLIVLDGVPIFDADEVMNINPLRIKKIEIVNKKFLMGSLVASGIIAIYSYNNDLAGIQLNNRALIVDYEGLQLQREFYSPKYETENTAIKRMPDFRNVLLWEPNIQIGKNHEAQLHFYTSDRKGKYIGVVEGINQNGLAGSTRFYFDVQ